MTRRTVAALLALPLLALVAVSVDGLQPGVWTGDAKNSIWNVLPNPRPPGNPENIMGAWSGGAFDTLRNRLIVWGGGHGDYAGNEIYTFDLATLTWARAWGPSPNIPDPLGAPCFETNADGNPVSRHTYDGLQYLPSVDRLWSHGGSLACGSGAASFQTWTFDFEHGAWTQKRAMPTTMLGITSAYDQLTGHVFVQSALTLYEYDPLADTYTARANLPAAQNENLVRTAAIDPAHRLMVVMGDGDFYVWNLQTMQVSRPLASGATSIQNARAPGLVYDPVSKALVAWAGGATVYTLDVTAWTWTAIVPASTGTSAVTPTAPTATGTYGRFQYVPSRNVFIGVNSIYEPVFIYKLNPDPGIPPGQISIPLRQWVALPAPPQWSTVGVSTPMKHVTAAYHPPSGRIYFNGGDYSGPTYAGGVGTTDSYRQETWSLSILERFLNVTSFAAGWRAEYPYCGASGIQPKHPDYTGFVWDPARSLFYMVPGVMPSISQGDCPGETPDTGSNPNFISGQMMSFDPMLKRWAVLGNGYAGDNADTWMSVLDPVTDTLIRFGLDLKFQTFDLKAGAWSGLAPMPGNANLWKEYLAVDLVGRVIYSIDGLLGNLWRYNLDTRAFTNLGPVPGGPIGFPNLTYIAWDSVNSVLLWHQEGTSFSAYHPATNTWETLSVATNVPGVNATGRLMIYDPVQNVTLLYGGTSNPQPYLFFYRYGP